MPLAIVQEPNHIRGVESAAAPSPPLRDDCSINRAAVSELKAAYPYFDMTREVNPALMNVGLIFNPGEPNPEDEASLLHRQGHRCEPA